MKKFFLCVLVVVLLSGCGQDAKQSSGGSEVAKDKAVSTNVKEEKVEKNKNLQIMSIIETDYDTGYKIKAKYAISDQDYKMYNDILDALNADFSKPEDEILAGLTGKYGMSVSQLKAFMRENMQDAIDRDMGKTVGEATISDMQVIECGRQVIMKTIRDSGVKIPVDRESWDISKTGLRYVLKCSFEDGESNSNEAIIKIEYNKDYSKFTLLQLKYNGVNISL